MATSTPENALSQYDLGIIKTQIGFYETLFRLHDLKVEHCIPAIVKEYDNETNKVKVQPLVYKVSDTPSGEVEFSRPEYEVQVRNICHGGFSISIPLFKGDTGWLISCDRNATTAKEQNATQMLKDQEDKNGDNKGEQKPDDSSTGGFEFGFFLPDYFGENPNADNDGMTIAYTPEEEDEGKFVANLTKDALKIVRTGSDGDDEIKLTNDGIEYDGTPDREQEIVTNVRYDLTTHCLQKKTVTMKMRGDFIVETSDESDWTTIDGGQAVPETTSSSS